MYITAVPEVVMAEPDTTSFANVQLWNCYKPQFYEIRNVHDILPGRETMTRVSYSAQYYPFYYAYFRNLWNMQRSFEATKDFLTSLREIGVVSILIVWIPSKIFYLLKNMHLKNINI